MLVADRIVQRHAGVRKEWEQAAQDGEGHHAVPGEAAQQGVLQGGERHDGAETVDEGVWQSEQPRQRPEQRQQHARENPTALVAAEATVECLRERRSPGMSAHRREQKHPHTHLQVEQADRPVLRHAHARGLPPLRPQRSHHQQLEQPTQQKRCESEPEQHVRHYLRTHRQRAHRLPRQLSDRIRPHRTVSRVRRDSSCPQQQPTRGECVHVGE
mmetsp:Transcript_15311/g.38817  ORF Transcript_15311/g.38817 Transcript_15311/m.38817 type:complete len:214 (+) Transcript_15311:323-964(+)